MLMRSARGDRPGVARRQVTFFCFAKRKVTKEKATRSLGPFADATGNLRCSIPAAVQTTRLRLKQVWPDLPPPSALLGPARTGGGKKTGSESDAGSRTRCVLQSPILFALPQCRSGRAERHRRRRIKISDVRRLRSRQVSEISGSSEQRKEPRSGPDSRLAFSLVTFFWRSKRKLRAAGLPPACSHKHNGSRLHQPC